MLSSKCAVLLAVVISSSFLPACKFDPSPAAVEGVKQKPAAEAGRAEQAKVSRKFYRCLLLATNGELVAIPKSIVDSDTYKACLQQEAIAPMTDEEFQVAVAELYPMEKFEESNAYFCTGFNTDEVCLPKEGQYAPEGYVNAYYSPVGTLKKLDIKWKGHALGNKLHDLWGQPASTHQQSTGMAYFYQVQDYPYVILSIGGSETAVATTFEL